MCILCAIIKKLRSLNIFPSHTVYVCYTRVEEFDRIEKNMRLIIFLHGALYSRFIIVDLLCNVAPKKSCIFKTLQRSSNS